MTYRVSRREFLARAIAAFGAIATSRLGLFSSEALALGSKFTKRLPMPKTLTGPRIELVAKEAEIKILPGAPTRMWTFNGSFPGPIIRRPRP